MKVHVIDPDRSGHDRISTLDQRENGAWALEDREYEESADGTIGAKRFIGPGWVDLHCHVYHGVTPISLPPDRVGLDDGVHLLVDAGSAGQATLPGLVEYVRPRSETRMACWINIGSHGLVHLRETAHAEFIDVDATIAAISAYPEFVRGVKVRSSGAIVGDMGIQPLQLGKLVARETGLPLMVHIGEAPPLIDDVLDLLDPGDVITHCFHGKTGAPWHPDGSPRDALRRARERGVLCDVGHGAASFSSRVARAAVAAGHPPDTISTDIHVRNVDGPVHDLATIMSKMLSTGMPPRAVVTAVTSSPRSIIGLIEPWLEPDGRIAHATVFDVSPTSPATRTYHDAAGTVDTPTRHIVPVATIRNGRWRDCRRAP